MLLLLLLFTPFLGIVIITVGLEKYSFSLKNVKNIALTTSIISLLISLVIFISYDSSTNQFQHVYDSVDISPFDIYLGIDGMSLYFLLLFIFSIIFF